MNDKLPPLQEIAAIDQELTLSQPEALRLADDDLVLLSTTLKSGRYDSGDIIDACLAIDELRRLHAEVEALRADAERYRWLRDQTTDDGIAIVMKNKHIDDSISYPDNINRYIDAARGKP